MQSFLEIVTRLQRAQGHLAGVIAMMAAARPCIQLAQQPQAVGKAIGNAKKELVNEHLNHCVAETSQAMPREFRALIQEFQGVTTYL